MRVADIFYPSLAIAGCSTGPGPTAMILKAAEHGRGWDHPWSGSAPWTAVRNPSRVEAYLLAAWFKHKIPRNHPERVR
jgi:hypothetical protein